MNNKSNVLFSFVMIAVVTILAVALLISMTGSNVILALNGFLRGIVGSSYAISEVFVKATPLILTGLGVAVGLKSGFVNIGAEGQLYIGAIVATTLGLLLPNLPKLVLIPLCIIGGFIGGGIWALIPGLLKAKFGISEVINTIMFNYISIGIVGILLQTVLKDPNNYFPVSSEIAEGAKLSKLVPGTRVHSGIIIALICAIVVYILIYRTTIGYRMRAVGINQRACLCSGIPIDKHIILSSLISGGLAGIAGMCEISGLHYKLIEGISPGYGYLAIIVALLGGNHPFGVVIAAIGISALLIGSLSMQRVANVPSAISSIILGVLVLLLMGRQTIFAWVLKERGK